MVINTGTPSYEDLINIIDDPPTVTVSKVDEFNYILGESLHYLSSLFDLINENEEIYNLIKKSIEGKLSAELLEMFENDIDEDEYLMEDKNDFMKY